MKNSLLLFFLFVSIHLFSQEATDTTLKNVTRDTSEIVTKFEFQNSIQLELLGSGSLYSFNYERILLNGNRWKTVANIGFCYWVAQTWNGFVIPVGISELYSMKNHHLVVGFGASPNYVSNIEFGNSWELFLSGRAGYRFQKPKGRMIFGLYYTPILLVETGEFGNWGGISFGFTF